MYITYIYIYKQIYMYTLRLHVYPYIFKAIMGTNVLLLMDCFSVNQAVYLSGQDFVHQDIPKIIPRIDLFHPITILPKAQVMEKIVVQVLTQITWYKVSIEGRKSTRKISGNNVFNM